jgi:hypothetical protein
MRLSLAILFSAGLLGSAAYAAETQDPAPTQATSGNQRICRVIREYNQRQFKEFQDRGLMVKQT